MSRPTVDQASKQNFVVNIQDSEFGKLVVRWRERDIYLVFYDAINLNFKFLFCQGVAIAGSGLNGHFSTLSNDELKKCVNTNGYVVAEASVKYHPWP